MIDMHFAPDRPQVARVCSSLLRSEWWRAFGHGDGERQRNEDQPNGGAPTKNHVQTQTYGLLQGTDTEGGNAVAHLVEGDQVTCRRSSNRSHLPLAEADDERQQSRATQTSHPEGEQAKGRMGLRQ